MLKKLRALMKLRAWLKSDTLKAGGFIGALGAAQTFLQSDDGAGWIDWAANIIGLTSGTASGLALGGVGLVMLVLRAKTEWGLDEKIAGKDKQGGFTALGVLGFTFFVGVALLIFVPMAAHADETKTFSWTDVEPQSVVEAYQLGCGPALGVRDGDVREWEPDGTTSRALSFPSGVHFCAIRIRVLDSGVYNPLVSDWSNEVSFTIPIIPQAPAGLTVD